MRSFDDKAGHHWQAALMEASFGNVLVIFSRIGDDGVFKKPLPAANFGEAEQILSESSTDSLCAMLAEAQPWVQ